MELTNPYNPYGKTPVLPAKWIQYLSFLWLILLSQQVQARDPISAALQIAPPYSVYLQDYASDVKEPMKVQVTLLHLQQPFYDVRLHLKIEYDDIVVTKLIEECGTNAIVNLLFDKVYNKKYLDKLAIVISKNPEKVTKKLVEYGLDKETLAWISSKISIDILKFYE